MREIKLRAWFKNAMLGQVCSQQENRTLQEFLYDLEQAKKDHGYDFILMQYTGLKDKNGKEIYEAYITSQSIKKRVNNSGTTEKRPDIRIIKFLNGAFRQCYPDSEDYGWTLRDFNVHDIEFKVIGNIYENPEIRIK